MSALAAPNPYVGPKSFTENEAAWFFGREREVQDLVHLVIAERIVLLYSPSGAGKTSLLQAGIIPALREERFRVLPLIRVNKEPPERPAETSSNGLPNRFVLSTLHYLEEGLPDGERLGLGPAALETTTLKDYLDQLPRPLHPGGTPDDVSKYDVLVFDQFEEILTIEPASRAARRARIAFFEQVADALYDRHRWAIFTLREDYLAGLDPYRRPIPTRLANHFRLDLLQREDAGRAITGPPQAVRGSATDDESTPPAAVTFADDAVTELLQDLGSSPGYGEDRTDADRQVDDALYIEPLHLQLVCDSLWRQLKPAPGAIITAAQLGESGDVDSALRAHYDEHVATIAGSVPGAEEREIRDWFEHGLILREQGVRGQVSHGFRESGGLDNRIVGALVEAKLVNRETRLKAVWYELAHDRLIGPVRDSNDNWSATQLNSTQRAASEWDRADEPDTGLLGVGEWMIAKRWASRPDVQLRDYEQRFVDQSGNSLTRRFVYPVLTVVLLAAIAIGWWVTEERRQGDRDTAITIASAWAGRALSWLPLESEQQVQLDLGLLLAVEAYNHLEREGVDPTFDVRHSLFNGLVARPFLGAPLPVQEAPDEAGDRSATLAIRQDGRMLATTDSNGQVLLVDVPVQLSAAPPETPGVLPQSPDQEMGSASALAFSDANGPGPNLLALGYADSAIGIWDVTDHQIKIDLGSLHRPEADPDCGVDGVTCDRITNLVFGRNGLLAAGRADGAIDVWDMTDATSPGFLGTLLRGDAVPDCGVGASRSFNACIRVTSLEFGLNGLLVAGFSDGGVWSWQDSREQPEGVRVGSLAETWPVESLAISPDGQFLAFGGQGGFFLHRLGVRASRPLETEPVTALAFNPLDTTTMFSSHVTGEIIRWELSQLGNPVPVVDSQATVSETTGQTVVDMVFTPDGRWLISRAADSTVELWNPLGLPPIGQSVSGWSPAHSGCVASLTFDPEANVLVSSGDDNMEEAWDLNQIPVTPVPTATAATPSSSTDSGDEPVEPNVPAPPGVSGASTPGSERVASRSCADGDRLTQSELVSFGLESAATRSEILSGASSADGSVLVTAHRDGATVLWEARNDTWSEVGPLSETLGSRIVSIARSDDGDLLAIGSAEGTIMLWEKIDAEWEELGQIPGHFGAVTVLSFDPDGDKLASGDDRGTVVVWNFEVDAWIDYACARAGRSLTDEEVSSYLRQQPENWEPVCSVAIAP